MGCFDKKCNLTILLLLLAVLTGYAPNNIHHKSESAFISWWKEPHYKLAVQYNFVDLIRVEGMKLQVPEFVDIDIGTILAFYSNLKGRDGNPNGK